MLFTHTVRKTFFVSVKPLKLQITSQQQACVGGDLNFIPSHWFPWCDDIFFFRQYVQITCQLCNKGTDSGRTVDLLDIILHVH